MLSRYRPHSCIRYLDSYQHSTGQIHPQLVKELPAYFNNKDRVKSDGRHVMGWLDYRMISTTYMIYMIDINSELEIVRRSGTNCSQLNPRPFFGRRVDFRAGGKN